MRRGLPALAVALVLLVPAALPALADEAPPWVVVTAPAYHEVVEPLCAHREAQGYRVVRLRLPDGGTEPEALRRLLASVLAGAPEGAAVLLVGDWLPPPGTGAGHPYVVPAPKGTVGRMRQEPTDHAYACLDGDLQPDVALGRFPASTVEEARAMVAKTLAFERAEGPRPWRHRITLLVGHPGGGSALERRFASAFVTQQIEEPFSTLDPRWKVRAILHVDASPHRVPDGEVAAASRAAVEAGQLLTVYLGHSNATGLASAGVDMLTREDWRTLDLSAGPGILLSCGCYTCQVTGFLGEGFGVAAMENPRGPVAVVGAEGESYGAMGKLAFEGLLPLLRREDPPTRLGDWFLAMKRGIAKGPIGRLTFWLYDRADGTGGAVPLETQRLEHLEMWMLLGDPALRLPLAPPAIALAVEGAVRPGAPLAVRGRLPESLAGAAVTVTLEAPFGARDAVAAPLAKAPAVVEGRAFSARLALPDPLPGERWILRARAVAGNADDEGALVLEAPPADD